MQPLFQLVGFGIGLEVHRTAGVLWSFQDPRNRLRTPLIRLLWQRLPVTLGVVSLNRQDVLGGQQLGNLHGAFPRDTQVKKPFDDLGGFLVYDPLLFVRWVFQITVGRIGAEVFPGICTRTLYGKDGLPRIGIDEYMKHRLQAELTETIVGKK